MAVLADDQMIMHRDLEGFADGDDLLGHVDVVGRRLRVAGGVVVEQTTLTSIALILFLFF